MLYSAILQAESTTTTTATHILFGVRFGLFGLLYPLLAGIPTTTIFVGFSLVVLHQASITDDVAQVLMYVVTALRLKLLKVVAPSVRCLPIVMEIWGVRAMERRGAVRSGCAGRILGATGV